MHFIKVPLKAGGTKEIGAEQLLAYWPDQDGLAVITVQLGTEVRRVHTDLTIESFERNVSVMGKSEAFSQETSTLFEFTR